MPNLFIAIYTAACYHLAMESRTFYSKIYAKANLSLAITGRRGDMHTLDMIVCPFEEMFDEVEFIPDDTNELKLEIRGSFDGFDPERFEKAVRAKLDKAARRLNAYGTLKVNKGIVLGAGLGGSSAVLAGAVNAMLGYCRENGKEEEPDAEFLCALGSDVPYMRRGGICRVRGTGEIVEPIECQKEIRLKAVIAKGGSDTAKCYALYDELNKKKNGSECGKLVFPASVEEAVALMRNDLCEPAEILNPNIKAVREKLEKEGHGAVIMSGSGSCVLGVTLS